MSGVQWLNNRKGQALVEFALLLPFIMLVLIGIVEFGRAWNAKQMVTDAAREGARWAVVGNPLITTQQQVSDTVKRYIARGGFDTSQVTITYPDGFKTGTGNITTVTVAMSHRFVALHKLITLLTNSSGVMTLRSSARMRNE